jgi:hypothetical protein
MKIEVEKLDNGFVLHEWFGDREYQYVHTKDDLPALIQRVAELLTFDEEVTVEFTKIVPRKENQ